VKSLLSNRLIVLLVRVFLGGVFVIASLDKIVDPAAFAVSILNYKVVSVTPALVIATVLPWAELLCGLGLLLGLYPRGSSLLAASMLAVFTVLMGSALLRGLDISCGCFSQDPSVGRIGGARIAEDAGLFILSIFSYYAAEDTSLLSWTKRRPTEHAA